DRTNGQPPRRAVVAYYPLFPNPHSAALTTPVYLAPASAPVRPDGSYCLAVLPGPGAVVVTASPRDAYASTVLDEGELAGLVGDRAHHDGGAVISIAVAGYRDRRSVERYNAIALINPDEKAKSPAVDLTVQPARRVRGTVVGPGDQPLTGVRVIGLTSMADTETLPGASFTVEGLNALRPRELSFHHAEKGLGKIVALRGDETQPVMVRLEPFGEVSGRLVDGAGKPVPRVPVSFFRG